MGEWKVGAGAGGRESRLGRVAGQRWGWLLRLAWGRRWMSGREGMGWRLQREEDRKGSSGLPVPP